MRTINEKDIFVKNLKLRIKDWVVEVLNFCEILPQNTVTRVINFQLIKSATSTGANYSAACNARSKNEFFAKISITVEEADESRYWLEIIEAKGLKCNNKVLKQLIKEIEELLKIFSSARKNSKK